MEDELWSDDDLWSEEDDIFFEHHDQLWGEEPDTRCPGHNICTTMVLAYVDDMPTLYFSFSDKRPNWRLQLQGPGGHLYWIRLREGSIDKDRQMRSVITSRTFRPFSICPQSLNIAFRRTTPQHKERKVGVVTYIMRVLRYLRDEDKLDKDQFSHSMAELARVVEQWGSCHGRRSWKKEVAEVIYWFNGGNKPKQSLLQRIRGSV